MASRLAIQTSPAAVRGVILGRTAVAGQMLFRDEVKGSNGEPDEYIFVLGLGGFPVTAPDAWELPE